MDGENEHTEHHEHEHKREEKPHSAERKITLRESTIWQIIAGVLAIILVASILTGGFGIINKTSSGAATPQEQTGNQRVQFTASAGNPTIGNANAQLTIIEFSDPSCPYCGAAAGGNQQVMDYLISRSSGWTPAIPGIIKDYVNTGKAKLVFNYYPGHGTGAEAMKIAWCANDQGKFRETINAMFQNQADVENVAKMRALAITAGADSKKLDDCLASKKYDSKLQSDTQAGQRVGVSGTPAFLIGNSQKGYASVVGAQPYSALKAVIDQELA
ncbi:MAG: DsbA family protein [Nanoarchaeota archaeon]